jgi:hypothetical protein
MNLEIGTEAAQFPEKKYTNGIFLAVHPSTAEKMPLNICPLYTEKVRGRVSSGLYTKYISVSSITPSTAEERSWSSGL